MEFRLDRTIRTCLSFAFSRSYVQESCPQLVVPALYVIQVFSVVSFTLVNKLTGDFVINWLLKVLWLKIFRHLFGLSFVEDHLAIFYEVNPHATFNSLSMSFCGSVRLAKLKSSDLGFCKQDQPLLPCQLHSYRMPTPFLMTNY